MVNLKATGKMVLVQPDTPYDHIGSLYLPIDSRVPRNTGTVLAVPKEYIGLQVGDRVGYNHREGYEVEHEEGVILSIDYDFIAAKIIEV